MKIRFLNYRKYKMTKMPFRYYLPMFEKSWSNKIWQFTIFRDYGIEFDFRKNWTILDLLTKKEQEVFFMSWFIKRN